MPILALIGLAILGFYGVPAVVEHDRLERDHARLEHQAHEAQALLERRRRELRDARRNETTSKRAYLELMGEGGDYLASRKR